MTSSDTGKKIRMSRKEKKITQTKLAMALGVSQGTICSWEKGAKIEKMKVGKLMKLAQALGKPISYFVELQ